MRIDLDIDLLRCFVAVAQAGSFTGAGDAIGLSQSGVSVRIKRLEEQTRRRLLDRSSRAVTLTPEGELLLGYAQRMLDLNDETVRRLLGTWAEGQLRIGIADYFAPDRLPGLLARFRRQYPRVRLDVRTGLAGDLLPAFERGELDIVVAIDKREVAGGEVLLHEPLLWTVAPRYTLDLTATVPLIVLPASCSHRRAAIDALDAVGRPWEIVFTSSSIAGVQAAARAGLGIAVLPQAALLEDLRPAGRELALPELPRSAIAVYSRDATSSAAGAAFIAFLKESFGCPADEHAPGSGQKEAVPA